MMPATDWAAEGYTDLGSHHWYKFFGWFPDRDLNPQYADIPDIERCGAAVPHLKPDGTQCEGFIHIDTPDVRKVFPGSSYWTVESWEPLTVSPSLLCDPAKGGCGDHGVIKQGRWVTA